VREFWQQDWPIERWTRVLSAQLAGDYSRPYLVLRDGRPFAYLEVYRTSRDIVGRCYPAHPHDLGVHLAIGELVDTGRGLGRELLRELAPALQLADPACDRVLVEPDARNTPARKMFSGAGFTLIGEYDLGHKRAAVLVYDRLVYDR
jgi:RimJ/RimL family protein N-acetyltransferase